MNQELSIVEEYESSDSGDSSEVESLNQDSSSPSAPSFSPLSSDDLHYPENNSDESEDELATLPSEEVLHPNKSITTSYSIVGDNIDKSIKPRYQRIGTGNRQLHYFHFFAASDRVGVNELTTPPMPPTITPEMCASSLLPSPTDDRAIHQNITTLVSRILATHLETLGFDCTRLAEWHIHHEYEEEMAKKSEVVCPTFLLRVRLSSVLVWKNTKELRTWICTFFLNDGVD